MKIEESNDEIRDNLKDEVTGTYSLIDKIFKSFGFFTEVLNSSILNFIDFFSNKNK